MEKSRWRALSKIFTETDPMEFNPFTDRYMIFSDVHLGMKDFNRNKFILVKALDHYYQCGFSIINLGDFEELYRYDFEKIEDTDVKDVYDAEKAFLKANRYIRVVGNHDFEWRPAWQKRAGSNLPDLVVQNGFKLQWGTHIIFMAHGHQGDLVDDKLWWLGRLFVRTIAKPLGLPSLTSVATNYYKRKRVERDFYQWAKKQRVLFIAGHTHRPAFESLTKVDRLRIRLEGLMRAFVETKKAKDKEVLRKIILALKERYQNMQHIEGKKSYWSRFSQADLLVPCYFNDGCSLHPNGITCIELTEGEIRLVRFFDSSKEDTVENHQRGAVSTILPADAGARHMRREILESESLEYVFSRIELLS